MTHKKQAVVLSLAVMLAQTSLLSTLADSQIDANAKAPSIQVASVIQRPDIEGSPDQIPQGAQPSTPDIYTIDVGEGGSPITIQALAQADETASLMVNGQEVLRYRSEAGGLTPFERVKAVADRLNRMLVTESAQPGTIRPTSDKKDKKLTVLHFGDEVLATVDLATAKAAKTPVQRLAFTWSNRLRAALGEQELLAKDYVAFLNPKTDPRYMTTGRSQIGMASWYGNQFHGRRTASGTRFNQYGMTAAHRTLPFGTWVRVTNQRSKRSCVVKITDRGPYAHGRIIDLSRGAAQAIGMSGVARVTLEVVRPNS